MWANTQQAVVVSDRVYISLLFVYKVQVRTPDVLVHITQRHRLIVVREIGKTAIIPYSAKVDVY